ncbi:hypothetical protein [Crocosphaera sp. XPORK-15E]|uniref:hypothetical protein n=1 Tax=Crocosphaera sp. XPORK-15E TaxID=3110247 RepID=UPI002B1FA78F|nr:hypothetical protein [Crocosphaera sp. XPORK-15E]MEA5535919.1 hypothetical protein [Crocosphaera sp. XPORK-15E]
MIKLFSLLVILLIPLFFLDSCSSSKINPLSLIADESFSVIGDDSLPIQDNWLKVGDDSLPIQDNWLKVGDDFLIPSDEDQNNEGDQSNEPPPSVKINEPSLNPLVLLVILCIFINYRH